LVVEPAAVVMPVTQHIKSAQPPGIHQLNVGASASHLGGDRNPPDFAGPGDDGGFLGVVSCVEYRRIQSHFLQCGGELVGGCHALGTDQNRASGGVDHANPRHGRVTTPLGGGVNPVRCVNADARIVPRHNHDLELMEFPQFVGNRDRRVAHA
jgi:hypothetical protein